MSRRVALTFIAVSLLAAIAPAQSETILIYQKPDEPVRDGAELRDLNVWVDNFLATAMIGTKTIRAIVYGLEDPAFRTAALAGQLGPTPKDPTDDDLARIARGLKAGHVVWIRAVKKEGSAFGNIRLFRAGREIWKDERRLTVDVTGGDTRFDSGRGLADTWLGMMLSGPLKALRPGAPTIETPEMRPGQEAPRVEVPVERPVDNVPLSGQVEGLIKANKRREAVLLLRDAVDQAPQDVQRRGMLIDLLAGMDPAAAAEEARRTALLMGNPPGLRLIAARASVATGDLVAAREDVNQILSREPNHAGARILSAELELRTGKPALALEALKPILATNPPLEAIVLRAIARAQLGAVEGVEADLVQIAKIPAVDVSRLHNLATDVLGASFQQAVAEVRTLLQRAAVRGDDPAVKEKAIDLSRQASARARLYLAFPTPSTAQASHDRWGLAHNLLKQSVADLLSQLDGSNEDGLSDARLNLAEAIKQANVARSERARELGASNAS